ncbi:MULTISPECIES: rhodanese-like domain-containing protein [Geobacillus]|uniref:rhodanese-like domain-containing protein n=1 Tax=Geobacillus TaxID=129337 RepID=UPI0005A5D22A|nr:MULTISPECIES: rhodanese-like domain-containing protein [Geobacillus]MED4972163.1 rhodanese-like domain-containing protein [Geobacillus thermoleovorans]OPX02779.1 rhodanese [Geobacillus sp. LEMMY01]QCK82252.1 rhodanese-like domain-containing protein [Geobacillus kaustophilus NBRC 102445]
MSQTIINIILFVLLVWFFASRFIPPKGVRMITTAELKRRLKEPGVQYIDVRTPTEFRSYHLPGFRNIPLHELATRVHELSKEKEVIVICQSGMRSQKASKILKKLGFRSVTNVKGGLNAWQ